jgi:hypothetical protein
MTERVGLVLAVAVLAGAGCGALGYVLRVVIEARRDDQKPLKPGPKTGSPPVVDWTPINARAYDDWATGNIGPAVRAITATAPVKAHRRRH